MERIEPFARVGLFELYCDIKYAKEILEKESINYTEETWENDECTVPVPWEIIHASNGMDLYFAKNKLFKIRMDESFEGTLPNGIRIGMDMSAARQIDKSLVFDEWEEDWQSDLGYWIEDDIEGGTVSSITIFVKEAMNADEFELYEWCQVPK